MASGQGFDSHFGYVVMAARRARQLQNGSLPLVISSSTKACRVAQDEIAAGKVTAGPRRDAVVAEPEESLEMDS